MEIKNLGPITSTDIDISEGMIFIGPNNSGKTYLTYTLYAILKLINNTECEFMTVEEVDELFKRGTINLDIAVLKDKFISSIEKRLKRINEKDLPEYFNVSSENFVNTELSISYSELSKIVDLIYFKNCNKENNAPVPLNNQLYWALSQISDDGKNVRIDIDFTGKGHGDIKFDLEKSKNILNGFTLKRMLFQISNILYIPAERNGLNVFRKELIAARSSLYDEGVIGKNTSKYPRPISDYLNYLNMIDINIFFENSEIELYNFLSENVIKGKFEKINDDVFFRQFYRKDKKGLKYIRNNIPFHVSSSSAKSLYGMDVYFEHLVSKGDILFIDEPEMNLDPRSQANMADFLNRCIDFGVKIIISTHSYNLMREFVNKSLEDSYNRVLLYEYDSSGGSFSKKNMKELESLPTFDEVQEEIIDRYYDIIEKQENSDDYFE